MQLQTIIEKLETMKDKIDVSGVDFLAVQVNLADTDPGVFYIEVKDHQVSIAPYEYHDRNCAITISSVNFNKLLDGKLDPVVAFTMGKLKVDGDLGKALEFAGLLKKHRK